MENSLPQNPLCPSLALPFPGIPECRYVDARSFRIAEQLVWLWNDVEKHPFAHDPITGLITIRKV